MNHVEAIKASADHNVSFSEIARKIYLTYPTSAFVGKEEAQYEILNAISIEFDVPITSVQVAGSAKVGRSFHKGRDFIYGESDLDIAIIDGRLYLKLMEFVLTITRGYTDLAAFPRKDGKPVHEEYLHYMSRGIFHPNLMPQCPQRADWKSFFGRLSDRHATLFRSISGVVYASQFFFESKQRSSIRNCLGPEVL